MLQVGFQILSFETIPFAVALIGSSLAAAWDLRTTEIPDWIPYAMIAVALLFYGAQSLLSWDYWPVAISVATGLAFFGFGFVMYYFGQWGGGDAKLLAAIGFLLPSFSGLNLLFPFSLSYLFNVFFVGAGYMLTYAFILALLNRKIFYEFKRDVKANASLLLIASVGLFIALNAINWILYAHFKLQPEPSLIVLNSVLLTAATAGIFMIWKFARAVENVGFKKLVPVKKLRVGDVLQESRVWEGVTERELAKIRRSGKRYVLIKQGVRFGPSFPLALLFTFYFGDAVLFLFRILG